MLKLNRVNVTHKVKEYFTKLWKKINLSINIKLSLWIIFSLIISIVAGIGVFEGLKAANLGTVTHIDYDRDRNKAEEDVLEFINYLYKGDKDKYEYIQANIKFFDGNVYIVDENGKVKYKNINNGYGMIDSINIDEFRGEITNSTKKDFKIMYPLTLDNSLYYFIMIDELEGDRVYSYEIIYAASGVILLVLFVILIYVGIRKKVQYIQYISASINEISKGDLNYVLKKEGQDELSIVAEQINLMEKNLLDMMEKERESERIQHELITNISHDLKTPLTIILGYLDIIRTKAYKNDKEKDNYVETAYEKAIVLQKMILDLFELVKLGGKENILNKSEVNINKLLRQITTDYLPMADDKNVLIDYKDFSSSLILKVDLEKIARAFNNLMSNAVKYCTKNTTITVTLKEDEGEAYICFSNKCNNISKNDVNKLFTRFYRGDKARNSIIEGSGIGLSIVKQIIDLHDSNIWAELNGDEIMFFIRLRG